MISITFLLESNQCAHRKESNKDDVLLAHAIGDGNGQAHDMTNMIIIIIDVIRKIKRNGKTKSNKMT